MPNSDKELTVESARKFAVAAKSLLNRRYNEMGEARRNSTSTFENYMKAVEAYQRQEELFHAAVQEWKTLHEKGTECGD